MDLQEMFPSYEFPIDEVCDVISENGYGKVLLQVPEGLKRAVVPISTELEERTGVSVLIDGDQVFGACDHTGIRGETFGLDAVIHLGHAPLGSHRGVSVHFFPVRMVSSSGAVERALERLISSSGEKRVGVVTTIQHIHLLEGVVKELERAGKEVSVGGPGKREAQRGQVLGCSFSSAREISHRVDAYVYIGTGSFHPMGVVLSTGKPVYIIDPTGGDLRKIVPEEKERFIRSRFSLVNLAAQHMEKKEVVGIIVSTKPGQSRMELARSLFLIVANEGFRAKLISMDLLTPMKIRSLGIRLACSTACPRIAVDDWRSYSEEGIVLLTPFELRASLSLSDMNDYSLDEEW